MAKGGTRSGKDQKKKLDNLLKKFGNKLKIRKLQDSNKRGRVRTKKKELSNIPVKERSAEVNKKARGLSTLGKDYTKEELKLSEKATKRSAEINKARYPEMGTYKGKDGKSVADEKRKVNKKKSGPKTPSGFVRDKGRLYAARSAQGKKLMNKLKAKKRAQEMAKNRKKK